MIAFLSTVPKVGSLVSKFYFFLSLSGVIDSVYAGSHAEMLLKVHLVQLSEFSARNRYSGAYFATVFSVRLFHTVSTEAAKDGFLFFSLKAPENYLLFGGYDREKHK